MKNIVYIINKLIKSGPVNVLYDTIANLDRSRYTPIIIKLMDDDPARSITDKFRTLDVEIMEPRFSFIELELRTKKIAFMLDKMLEGRNIDIIHAHGYHPVLVASHMKTKVARVATLHNICQEDFRYSKGIVLGSYMSWRYLRNLKKIDNCAAISNTVAEFYDRKGIPGVDVIYNGVNTTDFKPIADEDIQTERRRLNLPCGRIIITVVGRLSMRKDPLTIIEAYKKLFSPNDENAPLLIFLGVGELMDKCKKAATGYESIIFNGYTFNVADYLQVSDYSICASRSEGFGLVVIESLLTGTPAIYSDIGPFIEFTKSYEDLHKLCFRRGDADELACTMEYALAHQIPMEEITRDISERFSASRMSQNYMQLYDRYK